MPKQHPRYNKPCLRLLPIYHGEKGVSTRPHWKNSKDYTFGCAFKPYDIKTQHPKQYGKTVEQLCDGCKAYLPHL